MFRQAAAAGRRVVDAVSWKVVGVGLLSTPVVAIVQGAFLLHDYRANHGHAPRPNVPSRGLVVARSTDDHDEVEHPNSEYLWHPRALWNRKRPPDNHGLAPLRLLVIGDSLAAGVGTSQSSTPVLPESIAQALSRSLGGRAVYWTCVGVPGSSAVEIVQEIYHLEDDLNPTPTMFRQFAEWQSEQRRRAQDRLETARRRTQEWLEHRREEPPGVSKEPNVVARWWKRVRRDFDGLRRVIQDEESEDRPEEARRPIVRRQSLDPEVVGKYDVAVVLTGLNDLKDSFLPFMMSKERAKALEEAKKGNEEGGLQGELIRILHALESRMKRVLPVERRQSVSDGCCCEKDKSSNHGEQGPLVVFPGMPYEPTVLSQYVPLSWFVVPLLEMMDRNKKLLAEMFPGRVIYVEPPNSEILSDAEAKRGAQWQDFRVLLKLDDIAQNVKEKVERMMQQHYSSWVLDADELNYDGLYEIDPYDGVSIVEDRTTQHPGSTMVAADGVHPSDLGYSFWGVHIADAILKEWEKRMNGETFPLQEARPTTLDKKSPKDQ